jgi:hypothetical protein
MAKLQELLIGVVLVSMIAIGIASFLQGQADVHGVSVDTGFNNTFNTFTNMTDETNDIRDSISSADTGVVDSVSNFISGSYSALRIVLNIVFLPIDFFLDVGSLIGLPWWFSTGIIIIIVLLVAFAIINRVTGGQAT